MYNEKRKQQYLDEKSQDAKIADNIIKAFEDSEQYEEKIGRDISEWTTDQILGFYVKLATPYVQTLIVLHSSLGQYAEWCLQNGLIGDNQNHFREISASTVHRCADVHALKDRVFTRDELLEEIYRLPNDSDKFIILGLFEGIPIHDGVMARIVMGDLDGDELTLRNEAGIRIGTRTISRELRHIMENANDEKIYTSMASEQRSYPYDLNEKTIIKTILSRRNALRCTVPALANRMRNCFKWLGYENITIKSIMESGRIQFIKDYCKENKVTWQTAVNDKIRRTIHEDIYGRIQSKPVYMKTYGRFYA